MTKYLLLISILVITRANSQTMVYAELLGNGGFYSVNVEPEINKIWSARIGAGIFPFDKNTFVSIPMLIQARWGVPNHKVVLGGGASIQKYFYKRESVGRDYLLTASVGYLYLTDKSLFKISFTPLVTHKAFFPWIGIAFGYRFR